MALAALGAGLAGPKLLERLAPADEPEAAPQAPEQAPDAVQADRRLAAASGAGQGNPPCAERVDRRELVGQRPRRTLLCPVPQPPTFATDLLRASLGPALAAPYERAFGPVPWLTAGTLAWPAAAGDDVLGTWSAWAYELPPPVLLTAVRVGEAEVAVDVAVLGDPVRRARRCSRRCGPLVRTLTRVRSLGARAFRAPCALASAAVALPAFPLADELLDAPAGVCLGLRREAARAGPDRDRRRGRARRGPSRRSTRSRARLEEPVGRELDLRRARPLHFPAYASAAGKQPAREGADREE